MSASNNNTNNSGGGGSPSPSPLSSPNSTTPSPTPTPALAGILVNLLQEAKNLKQRGNEKYKRASNINSSDGSGSSSSSNPANHNPGSIQNRIQQNNVILHAHEYYTQSLRILNQLQSSPHIHTLPTNIQDEVQNVYSSVIANDAHILLKLGRYVEVEEICDSFIETDYGRGFISRLTIMNGNGNGNGNSGGGEEENSGTSDQREEIKMDMDVDVEPSNNHQHHHHPPSLSGESPKAISSTPPMTISVPVTKIWFRRAMAREHLKKYMEAKEDLDTCLAFHQYSTRQISSTSSSTSNNSAKEMRTLEIRDTELALKRVYKSLLSLGWIDECGKMMNVMKSTTTNSSSKMHITSSVREEEKMNEMKHERMGADHDYQGGHGNVMMMNNDKRMVSNREERKVQYGEEKMEMEEVGGDDWRRRVTSDMEVDSDTSMSRMEQNPNCPEQREGAGISTRTKTNRRINLPQHVEDKDSSAQPLPCPTPDQQRQIVYMLLKQSNAPRIGEAFFLIDFRWWVQFCIHVNLIPIITDGSGGTNCNGHGNNKNHEEKHLNCDNLAYILPDDEQIQAAAKVTAMLNRRRNRRRRKKGLLEKKLDDDDDDLSSSSTTDDDEDTDSDDEDSLDDELYYEGYGTRPGPINNRRLLIRSRNRIVQSEASSGFTPGSVTISSASSTAVGASMSEQHEWNLSAKLKSKLKARKNHSNDNYSDYYDGFYAQDPTGMFFQEWRSQTIVEGGSGDGGSNYTLRPQLVRGHHFEIIPREVYAVLRSWYGEMTPCICRRASQIDEKGPKVFLYPYRNGTNSRRNGNRNGRSNAISMPPSLSYNQYSGRVGLQNLGNTCFMNSALQCLSHATPLTRYFLTDRYRQDINASNPLGTGGKLASAYDAMIKVLWMSNQKKQSSMAPRALKRAIALFAPQFANTAQQDSQEFLAFLLDGLHEDLNRVKNPPYIVKPDVNHEDNLAVEGAKAWDAHCKRNQSVLLDTFYGQFKSTCVCPKCKQISVSFDAFNHVSLEIPQLGVTERIIPIVLFEAKNGRLTGLPPKRYGISVPKNITFGDVKALLSKKSGIGRERLAICDVYQSGIYEIFLDTKNVSQLNKDDLVVAYEVDPIIPSAMHVISTQMVHNGRQMSTLGYPLFLSFDISLSCRQVIRQFMGRLSYLITNGSSFQLRLVDTNGNPQLVFPAQLNSPHAASSIVPNTDDVFSSFLSVDCTDSFLFMHIEWNLSSINDVNRFESIVDHPSLAEALSRQQAMLRRNLTLDHCLENFTRVERLDEDNKWYCAKCKDHVRAEKTMKLWRLPNILVIQLKRFEFRNALRRDKMETFIDFPLEGLDMNRFCASSSSAGMSQQDFEDLDIPKQRHFVDNDIPATYDLFGVVNHYGRMGFGHYNAYARRWDENMIEDDWILFDDASVRGGITKEDVVSNSGYLLFYRRRMFA